MRKFRIVVEELRTSLKAKVYEANSLEEAKAMANADRTWEPEDGWEDEDGADSSYEVRDDLSYELSKAKVSEDA